jgi:hypothetical protein
MVEIWDSIDKWLTSNFFALIHLNFERYAVYVILKKMDYVEPKVRCTFQGGMNNIKYAFFNHRPPRDSNQDLAKVPWKPSLDKQRKLVLSSRLGLAVKRLSIRFYRRLIYRAKRRDFLLHNGLPRIQARRGPLIRPINFQKRLLFPYKMIRKWWLLQENLLDRYDGNNNQINTTHFQSVCICASCIA